MATQKFAIIDNNESSSDGIIQDREKNNVGLAWIQDAPNGHFINCSLDGYWIVSEEDYKKIKQLK